MTQPPAHDYHYGHEADQYTFYRLPKALFVLDCYKGLTDGAKILYGLMLDRMGLSIKNEWLDEQGRVFIYFTLEDVQEHMSCKHEKAVKMLAELDTAKGVGLIERVKQGQGKPTKIYVMKFIQRTEVQTSENQKSRLPGMQKSRLPKNRSQDFRKSEGNNTDLNNTELNDTEYPSYPINPDATGETGDTGPARTDGMDRIDVYKNFLMENIEYSILAQRYDTERLDEIVALMLDTVCSNREFIRIAADDYPAEVVRSRMLKINSAHVEYVFDCLDNNTTKVRNIKAYLLAALYNAPATMDSFYRAEVNHDLYGGGR